MWVANRKLKNLMQKYTSQINNTKEVQVNLELGQKQSKHNCNRILSYTIFFCRSYLININAIDCTSGSNTMHQCFIKF